LIVLLKHVHLIGPESSHSLGSIRPVARAQRQEIAKTTSFLQGEESDHLVINSSAQRQQRASFYFDKRHRYLAIQHIALVDKYYNLRQPTCLVSSKCSLGCGMGLSTAGTASESSAPSIMLFEQISVTRGATCKYWSAVAL
jgi:hypothetical protein